MNEVWLAMSAVAGLVVALATVWRIVARATHTLRSEIGDLRGEIVTLHAKTDEIGTLRSEIGALHGRTETLHGEIGTLRGEIGTLRDEIKKDTKREIDMLRENDLRHLAEGIKGLDTRIDRVEVRVTQSISRLERRLTDSMLQLEARLTDGQTARGSMSA